MNRIRGRFNVERDRIMQLNSDLLEKERENVELGRFVQNVLHSIGLNNLGHSNEPFIAEFVKKHINK